VHAVEQGLTPNCLRYNAQAALALTLRAVERSVAHTQGVHSLTRQLAGSHASHVPGFFF